MMLFMMVSAFARPLFAAAAGCAVAEGIRVSHNGTSLLQSSQLLSQKVSTLAESRHLVQEASAIWHEHLTRNRFHRMEPASQETAQAALEWMTFWDTDASKAVLRSSQNGSRFVSFESDGGGLNNMRMAFEFFVHMAKESGRTLVLPPLEGWYLIDWGPLAARKKNESEMRWLPGIANSTYEEFFDIDYLKRQIPVVSALEFYEMQVEHLHIPFSSGPDFKLSMTPDPNPWKNFLRKAAGATPLDCSQGAEFVKDMSIELVHFKYETQPVEYRFLPCAEPAEAAGAAKLLHFNPSLFSLASVPVAAMRPSQYAAVHLRRNDFQYVQAPDLNGSRGAGLLKQLGKHLRPQESLYIATDEVDAEWLKGFEKALAEDGHKIYSLGSFSEDLQAKGFTHRESGPVEEIICAAARVFLGTPHSTYTAGIQQLRERFAVKHGGADDSFRSERLFLQF